MKHKLAVNLGSIDARELNAHGAKIDMDDPEALKIGSDIELSKEAFEFVQKKYPGLLEPADVKGVAKASEVTAPKK